MKSPFMLGWADYVLIIFTCLLVLLFVERWNAPVEEWLKEITSGTRPEPAPFPKPLQDWLERRNAAAPGGTVPEATPSPNTGESQ